MITLCGGERGRGAAAEEGGGTNSREQRQVSDWQSWQPHCMKSVIFIRLTWNFRFATARGNLQATPKTAVNCRKLTWALLGGSPPMTPLPLILGETLTCK